MDIATPYCEVLNTHNGSNCAGDEHEFEKGVTPLFLKAARRGRPWWSVGLRKARYMKSEGALPFSFPIFPFLTVPHSFPPRASTLTLMCLLGVRVWPQAEQLSTCKVESIFAWREAYQPSEYLSSHTDFCLLCFQVRCNDLFPSGHNSKCELRCSQVSLLLTRVVLELIIMTPETCSHLSLEEVLMLHVMYPEVLVSS